MRKSILETLLQHLKQIAIPRHPVWDPIGHLAVQNYLLSNLQQYGAVTQQSFDVPGAQGQNLLVKLPGQSPHLSPILIGAHYDGVPGIQAADDNASGVAALLALAAAFAHHPAQRSVWIVGFDLEEWGMLGGKALAQSLRDENQSLHLMLSLEMLGYSSLEQNYPIRYMEWIYGRQGDYIALVGNLRSLGKLLRMSHGMRKFIPAKCLSLPNQGRLVPATRLSDHSPFWDQGYAAAMVTDTAFLRNPNYHKSSDTIASLDLDFLVNVTQGIEAAVRVL
ncbi:MAG: M28 family peptidase [Thermosynechococcaceae cyanobacterium MS004]|nr:M28 family peptidase [Thermosynechococcaceae cyanobacterium MS004]